MKIAVLSGKGGAGKTFISTNLASVWKDAIYMDCDVEAPNGHLFFDSKCDLKEQVTVKIPVVNYDNCNGCRMCTSFCKFNALAYFGQKVKVFEDICHHCLGCQLICPNDAITMKEKVVGTVSECQWQSTKILMGSMSIGEVSGVPIIEYLIQKVKDETRDVIIDCPPGSACVVMESVKQADYCLLVCEATPFGLHNVKMVYELVRKFDKPCGLMVNKGSKDFEDIKKWTDENQIHILGELPFDKTYHQYISNGILVSQKNDNCRLFFSDIENEIKNKMRNERSF